MYGFMILKQFDGDSKIGPMAWSTFDDVHGWKIADSNYKHEIEYEFGMAYYWNITLSGWLIIKAVVQILANPYAKPRRRSRKISEDSDDDLEDSEVSRRTEIDIYI